jgi:hypothetical protein
MRPVTLLIVLGVIAAGAAVALATAWLLWPVLCESTDIGFAPRTPDPNIHLCTRRIGTTVGRDGVRASAVAWGVAWGAVVIALGGGLVWWRERRARVSS